MLFGWLYQCLRHNERDKGVGGGYSLNLNEALTDSLVTSLVRGIFFLMRLNVLTDSLPKKITINRIHNAKHLHKTVISGVPNHLLLLGCNK